MTDDTRSTALAALVDRYCEAWSLASADERAAALRDVWADGATYTDPGTDALDAGGLLAYIAQVHARYPGAKVVRTSVVDVHHDVARFAWQLVRADGSTLPEGLDVVDLDMGALRIRRIVGFFGPLGRT